MARTPDYTRKAVDSYRDKFDIVNVRLPKGTRQKILDTGTKKINDFIVSAVMQALEKIAVKTYVSDSNGFGTLNPINDTPTPEKPLKTQNKSIAPDLLELYEQGRKMYDQQKSRKAASNNAATGPELLADGGNVSDAVKAAMLAAKQEAEQPETLEELEPLTVQSQLEALKSSLKTV